MADEKNIPPGGTEPPKIKLNLSSAMPRENPPVQIRASDKKSETTRLDLALAQPPIKSDTQAVRVDPSTVKRSTVRIETPPPAKAETQKVKTETQKVGPAHLQNTVRVEVPDHLKAKSSTTRIDIPESAFTRTPGTPPQAPRLPLADGADDVFKRTTIPVGIPTPPPAEAIGAKPKTISIKRPVAAPPATPVDAAAVQTDKAVSEAKKSETARIDLPADSGERPATRPKTIRIKRPDGTTARKALTISRPDNEPSTRTGSADLGEVGGEQPVGVTFSILALVAVLVACTVLYVFAAQTFAPDLPFPGKI